MPTRLHAHPYLHPHCHSHHLNMHLELHQQLILQEPPVNEIIARIHISMPPLWPSPATCTTMHTLYTYATGHLAAYAPTPYLLPTYLLPTGHLSNLRFSGTHIRMTSHLVVQCTCTHNIAPMYTSATFTPLRPRTAFTPLRPRTAFTPLHLQSTFTTSRDAGPC
jgi:hypothetical protein